MVVGGWLNVFLSKSLHLPAGNVSRLRSLSQGFSAQLDANGGRCEFATRAQATYPKLVM